jgi:hypothetical protein
VPGSSIPREKRVKKVPTEFARRERRITATPRSDLDGVIAGSAVNTVNGLAMPRGFYTEELRRKLEPVAVVFLLPIFFTFSGLNTRLDTVNDLQLLLIATVSAVCSYSWERGGLLVSRPLKRRK